MAIRAIDAPLSASFVKAMDAGKKALDNMYHQRMVDFFKTWSIPTGSGNFHFKAPPVQDLFERGF